MDSKFQQEIAALYDQKGADQSIRELNDKRAAFKEYVKQITRLAKPDSPCFLE